MSWTITICRARCAVCPHSSPLDTLQALRPVRRSDSSLEDLLLLDEVFLSGRASRCIAGVHSHSHIVALGLDVVVGNSAVPDDEIARAEVDLLEFVAALAEPCETSVLVAVPSVNLGQQSPF